MRFSIRLFLVAYLVSFFVSWPVLAAPKTIALAEVYDVAPSKQLDALYQAIGKRLAQSENIKLISATEILNKTTPLLPEKEEMNDGDKLFYQARDDFYLGEFDSAQEKANRALSILEKRPGVLNSLFGTHLLLSQIHLEKKKDFLYKQSLRAAMKVDATTKDLDHRYYSPSMRKAFKKEWRGFANDNQFQDITIKVKGNRAAPIFVNGSPRGTGLELTTQVVKGDRAIISAGNSYRAPVQVVDLSKQTSLKPIEVSPRFHHQSQSATQAYGYKRAGNEIGYAAWLGSVVQADQVVLISLKDLGHLSRLQLQVVQTKKQRASAAKMIDISNFKSDLDTASNVAADHVASLTTASFTQKSATNVPVLVGKKKGKGKAALWAAIGVLVVGAGVGAALGLSGGSSGGGSTNTATSVSGTAPEAP